jgi:7-carboxy-7-deazaguanine synthase
MFGKNLVRRQELGDGQRLWVQDLFYTLQGEGPFGGQPAVFLRLAGCNLRCFWCDTDFESKAHWLDLEEIDTQVGRLRPPICDLVVITGGEPLRQNISVLVRRLLDQGLRVQIETSGTVWVELPEHPRLFIVCSPKTARLHAELVPRVAAYKYVLAFGEVDPSDGLPMASTQRPGGETRLFRAPAGSTVYVMPRDDQDAEMNRKNQSACAEVSLRFGYTLTIQTHKLLGLD